MDPSQIDNYPALMPPPGVVSNFDNPYSIAPGGRIVIYITLPLMLIALATRVYARVRLTGTWGLDDWLCVIAAASNITFCGVMLHMFSAGYLGPHQWNVRLTTINPRYVTFAIVATCLYSVSAMFLKTSLLVFYLRIFRPSRTARIFIWAGMLTIPVFYLATLITSAVFCSPGQFPSGANPLEFIQAQATSNCNVPQARLSAVQGVFGTVSDIYVLLIPVILVSGLQLSGKRKYGLVAVFSVGLLAVGSSIATLYYRFRQLSSSDLTWITAIELMLGALEINIGVVCASMPSSLVLFRSFFKSDVWTRLRSYLRAPRSSHQAAKGSEEDLFRDHPNQFHGGLPQIPGAVMSGLRTFVRGGRGHQNTSPKSVRVETEMSTYSSHGDVVSVEEEYHRQLKKTISGSATSSAEA